jgi:arylsulfatase A-like enzyme
VLLLAGLAASCGEDRRPSLLLVTVDTLRADHVSAYGYSRPTSPQIDELAASGVLFETVISPLPETGPSFASLLTGRWPAQLGVRGNGKPLGGEFETLATLLSGAGYDTAAFVSGFPLVRRLSGLQRGFDHYDDQMPDPRGGVPRVQRTAEKTTDSALAWLDRHPDRPFFLWVHYYDCHGDYAPGPPFETLFAGGPAGPTVPLDLIPKYQRLGEETDASVYVARYDGEIRRVDAQVTRLLQRLEAMGRREQTVVALTSDHGESLTDHGYYFDHGNELYLPSMGVPLILAGPGIPAGGRRVDGMARLPDVMPTLLDLLGLKAPAGLAGQSLVPPLRGESPVTWPEAFSEARFAPYRALTPGADVGPKLAARDQRFTVILRLNGPHMEVYDRLADPGETRNLLDPGADPDLARPVRRLLDAGLRARLAAATGGAAPPRVFTEEVVLLLEQMAAGMEP